MSSPRAFAQSRDQPHRVVEHDGVVDRPLHVEQMRVFVDHPGLDHQEEAVRVVRQESSAAPSCSVRSG